MGLNPRLDQVRRLVRDGAPFALATAAISLLVLALLAGGTGVRDALSFDRGGIAGGEAWRAVTGHLVHLGPPHALLNVAGMLLIGLLVGREFSLRQWAIISLAVVASIDLGLWWLNPELDWYVGLSGVLHGWLAAGIVAQIVRRRPDAWLLLPILVAKLGYEQWQGPVPGSAEAAGGPVVVDAHLYGAIGGAIVAYALLRIGSRSSASARQGT